MKTANLPFKIKIASPCPARWADMGGDDRVRFCDLCHKNVYNLSAMTTAEAAALVESKRGQLCARIYQRADGTVLTEDCPVGIARQWRRVKSLVAGGVATMLFALAYTTALGREHRGASPTALRDRIVSALNDSETKVKSWIGLKPPTSSRPSPMLGKVIMGDIAVMPTVPPPPVAPSVSPTPRKP